MRGNRNGLGNHPMIADRRRRQVRDLPVSLGTAPDIYPGDDLQGFAKAS